MRTELVYGAGTVGVDLPDRTVFPSSGISTRMPVVDDLEAEIRTALTHPLDTPPLRTLVRPGSRVTIAFDDPTVGQYAPLWSTAVPLVIGELTAAGVDGKDIALICANALHRKFTHGELATLLGADFVAQWADRLSCHDAEDADDIVHLGTTEHGYEVELNRAVVESDLTVYVNAGTTRAFSGGWKSICVGLSTYRSIRAHHNPDDMSMSLEHNRMHEVLDEMGGLVSATLGRERIFKLECVQSNPLQVSRVFGGTVDACRAAALDLIRRFQTSRRNLVRERVDCVVYGVPDWSPYAAYSTTNPILTLISTGLGYMGGVIEAFGNPGCTVVLASPVPDRWDHDRHPSYREVWDRVLPQRRDPYEARRLFEEDFAARPSYIEAYRHHYGFHGVHGIMAIFPLKRLRHAGRVFVAGADDPSLVRHAGFEPFGTVEEALGAAGDVHGHGHSIACVRNPAARNRSEDAHM